MSRPAVRARARPLPSGGACILAAGCRNRPQRWNRARNGGSRRCARRAATRPPPRSPRPSSSSRWRSSAGTRTGGCSDTSSGGSGSSLLFRTGASRSVLLFGLNRVIRHDRRREIVIFLLWLVGIFNVGGVALLVASLLAALGRGDDWTPAAGERRRGAVWRRDRFRARVLGAGLRRAGQGGRCHQSRAGPTSSSRRTRTESSPGPIGRPQLWDYVYVSLTNSIAFSPTDSMPLTRDAKRLMAAESVLSGVTILLVAARAVNILS